MRTTIIFATMFFLFSTIVAQAQKEFHLLIGTYANTDKSNGLYVYHFNAETGDFKSVRPVTSALNSSYLAISDDKKNVYAVAEGSGAHVASYAFDSKTGALTFQNSVPADGPCYVSIDKQKKFVFVGNYGGGNLLSIPLRPDGSFESNVQKIQHEGSSVVKDRQEKPHVHSVVLSPDHQYLLVPDLGVDKVYQYKVEVGNKEALSPAAQPFTTVEPGGGPRHLVFHPNGKFAYLVLELEGAVAAFDYHDGQLTHKQTISMTPEGFKGEVSGADIHVSADGKFLYASNRKDADQIAIYSIDNKGGLEAKGHQSVLGKTPRNFALDPTGNFLLVANQNSNDIVVFKRDINTGMLSPTGKKILVDKPVCLKFVAIGK
jgi:6-phosphogluconolactonase